MPSEKLNGVELYYEVHGSGPPLVLIAGLASDSQSWQSVVGRLSTHHRVIVFDNRGCGRTTSVTGPISIPAIAEDCLALMHRLGLSTTAVLGHSMGGFVAQDLAARYPSAVDRLILVATSLSNGTRNNALFRDWVNYLESGMDRALWFRNFFYWIFSKHFFDTEKNVNAALRLALDYPYPQTVEGLRSQVEAIATYDSRPMCAMIKAKTLVMCGAQDLLYPIVECGQLYDAIRGATCRVIENAAHAMQTENPRQFTDCVQHFFLS